MLLLLTVVLAMALTTAGKDCAGSPRSEHAATFLSPAILLRPGDVKNKYFDVAAPVATGRFATVNFQAELVYADSGEPVLQSDVYLHHYSMLEYAVPAGEVKLAGEQIEEQVSSRGALYIINYTV